MKISSFCSLLSSIDDCQTVVSLSKQLSTVYHNRQARERVYVGISFEATVRGFELPIVPFGVGLSSALMGLLRMEWRYFCPMLSSSYCSSLSVLLSVLLSLVVARWRFSLMP